MKRITLLIVAIALLIPASSAMANSTCPAYSSLCSVSNNTSPSGASTGATTNSTAKSTLPFTGLDVVLLAAGGGTLLGAGLVVRRLSRGVS